MTVQGRLRPCDAAGAGEAREAPPGPGGEPRLRIGFTVTKRVGNAVERNRIKRRLRAATLDAGLPVPDMPLDVVVVARRDALTAEYGRLIGDLERALPVVVKPRSAKPRSEGPDRRSGSDGPKASSSGDERRGPSHA